MTLNEEAAAQVLSEMTDHAAYERAGVSPASMVEKLCEYLAATDVAYNVGAVTEEGTVTVTVEVNEATTDRYTAPAAGLVTHMMALSLRPSRSGLK